MALDILVGLQWGDEGKGKFIDQICPLYDIVARFNGGANAGHTIFFMEKKVTLRLLPSGIFYEHITNVLGSGLLIDPSQLRAELEALAVLFPTISFAERLLISRKAHLTLPVYRYQEIYMEGSATYRSIGTTKNGIGHTYANKVLRQGFRVGDIAGPSFMQEVDQYMRPIYDDLLRLGVEMPSYGELLARFEADILFLKGLAIADTELFLNKALHAGQAVLAEGAQASLLDIDHGTYPYVTASNTLASAACTSLGLSPKMVRDIFGVTKAYCTRVGNGPFVTEIAGELGDSLREKGGEFGSNTKRPRRIGWLDLPALKYAAMLNGVTQLIITKADVLNDLAEIPLCTHYEINGELTDMAGLDLMQHTVVPHWENMRGWSCDFSQVDSKEKVPETLQAYVAFLEAELAIPVQFLSVGPGRTESVALRD